MVLGGAAFEGRALINEISSLVREISQSSHQVGIEEEISHSEEGLHATMVAPWPWICSFHDCERYIFAIYKHPVCSILLQQPECTETFGVLSLNEKKQDF